MKPRTIKYYFKEALKSMKRNGLMTLASISTVALSLFMLGVFLCGVINLNNMASSLENQVQLSIYLKDGLTTEQIMSVGKQIKAIPNLKKLEFVNKEQAMKEFKERLGDQQQLVNALGGVNPLPNSYVLTFDNPSDVKATAKLATTFQGVESTLFIISNTIRLTVFARRKEIAIMKYVGATNGFIRWPFLIEGMLLGLIGAIIAVLCVGEFYHFITMEVSESLAFFPLVPMFPFFYDVAIYILGGGIVVGAIGSTISLKQYMKV